MTTGKIETFQRTAVASLVLVDGTRANLVASVIVTRTFPPPKEPAYLLYGVLETNSPADDLLPSRNRSIPPKPHSQNVCLAGRQAVSDVRSDALGGPAATEEPEVVSGGAMSGRGSQHAVGSRRAASTAAVEEKVEVRVG